MKKSAGITLLLLPFLLNYFSAYAQQSFSLKEAIAYATTHVNSIKNLQIDEQINIEKIKEYKGIGMPKITAQADYKQYFEFPQFVTPFSPEPISFTKRHNPTLSATASWLIFDATYLVGLQAQKELLNLSKLNIERSKIDAAEQVSKAYYTALITRKQKKLLEVNIDRISKLHHDVEALNKEGLVELLDVQKLSVTLNNLNNELTKVNQLQELTEALLKFQMGIAIEDAIILTDTLNNDILNNTNILLSQPNSFENRIEVKLLKEAQTLNLLNYKRYKMGSLPNLVGFTTMSRSMQEDYRAGSKLWFQSQTINTIVGKDPSSGAPIYNSNKIPNFYKAGLWGLTMNWTAFDGFQTRHKKNQVKLEMQKVDNDMINVKNAFTLELFNAKTNLKGALLTLKSQEDNMNLALEVIRVTKIKYNEGIGSNSDVILAETQYKEAQTNYFTALYNAYIAKVAIEKALGTIY